MKTIYECCKPNKDVNNSPYVVHYAESSVEAIEWLENNGGGVYRNTLHNYRLAVNSKKKNSAKTEAAH